VFGPVKNLSGISSRHPDLCGKDIYRTVFFSAGPLHSKSKPVDSRPSEHSRGYGCDLAEQVHIREQLSDRKPERVDRQTQDSGESRSPHFFVCII